MDIETFRDHFEGVRGSAARCPAHEDNHASLTINPGREGGIVFDCHAGCEPEDILKAVGLSYADVMGEPHLVETYDYHDLNGEVIYSVERWYPKDFRVRPGLPPPAQRVPYHLGDILWARQNNLTVYICEGEKDCNTLRSLGLAATCNVGGAGPGKWLEHYNAFFDGLDVVVIADGDEVGIAHARMVARGVRTTAASVALVRCSVAKDVTEALQAGYRLENILSPLPDGHLGLVHAINVKPDVTTWVWQDYVPEEAVTIIEGDPGESKSLLTCDLAARWSSGAPMPDHATHGGPYNIIMVNSEDSIAKTVVPRLITAGADLKRIWFVTHGSDVEMPFNITTDVPLLEELIHKHDIRILVIDPLMASLSAETDSHNDASVRRNLFPLFRLAQDRGLAIIVVRHLNKGSGRAIYRGGGSIAFTGTARACFNLGRDPEDENLRVLAAVKNNCGPKPASQSYVIENGRTGPFIEWRGEVDNTAQENVDGRRDGSQEIVSFLNSVTENGAMSWADIVAAGIKFGFTEKQLRYRRGKSKLTLRYGSEGNRSAMWGLGSPFNPPAASASFSPPKQQRDLADGPGCQNASVSWQGAEGQTAVNGDKEAELYSRPLECSECGTTEGVVHWAEPWWVVRCFKHNPAIYHAEEGDQE